MKLSEKQFKRSMMCGEVGLEQVNQNITLYGWVQKRRNLGGLIFLDLRDRTGIVQVALDPQSQPEAFAEAEKLRSEYVVGVRGLVQHRPEGQENTAMATGMIEVQATDLIMLNSAETPPFYIVPNVNADETLRLKYRYLDLRRPDIQNAIITRHHITKTIRDYLYNHGFLEIETPILNKSTPEGARDYLVPSRVNRGTFYALPQSPQIFKQLLMIGGYDRYYQIARCFRDEDLRADRQPEFTQIDIEMSFINEHDIQVVAEGMVKNTFKEILSVDLGQEEFPRMTYDEAMAKYGSDKPDIRFAMEMVDVAPAFMQSEFKVFKNVLESKGAIKALTVKGQQFSRKQIDGFTEYVKRYGAQGLVWLAYNEEGIRSSVAKFLSQEEIDHVAQLADAQSGDTVFIIASKIETVNKSLGALRLKLGSELALIDESKWAFLWVVDFPLFEYDEEQGRFMASHHPFTMPHAADLEHLISDPGRVKARAYDLVLNGVEIGGGSIRIHKQDIQEKMFTALGFTLEDAKSQFGFFIDALRYGTPPHGGIAFGLDRLVMEMLHLANIRDVIAFPKTTSASSLMSGAPNTVSAKQLAELYIDTVK